MNQSYAEAGVKKKDTAQTMLLRVLLIVGVVAGILIIMLGGLFTILGVAVAALAIFMFPMLKLEYEYVFIDGEIDFDKIIAKSRRKNMLRIDMEQVEIIAPENSHTLDGYHNQQIIHKDFTSGDKTGKSYIIIANVNEKRYRIAFEPSETMLTMMKQKSPRKVSQI